MERVRSVSWIWQRARRMPVYCQFFGLWVSLNACFASLKSSIASISTDRSSRRTLQSVHVAVGGWLHGNQSRRRPPPTLSLFFVYYCRVSSHLSAPKAAIAVPWNLLESRGLRVPSNQSDKLCFSSRSLLHSPPLWRRRFLGRHICAVF